jgi:flagellar biosynthesis/type III secretory pathway M-ring protein FliF/YscJ
MTQESNPWISQAEQSRRWLLAQQTELERVLSRFDGVKSARVFLNINDKRTLVARHEAPSSASVTFEMRSGERVSRNLAQSAARMVAGAVSGLAPSNVSVVDSSGRVALDPAAEAEDGGTSSLYRTQVQREQKIANQIRTQLADPKARVNVRVELDLTARTKTSQTTTDGAILEEERSSTTQLSGSTSQQPGVEPNVGTASLGAGRSEQSEQRESNIKYDPSRTVEESQTPRGDVLAVKAAISLSELYLTQVYLKRSKSQEPPTYEQLEEIFKLIEPRIIKQVTMLIKGPDDQELSDDYVAVNWDYDVMAEPPVTTAGAIDTSLEFATRYGAQSGLALLALISLGMMLRLARKTEGGETFGMEIGLPQDAIDAARRAAEDVELSASEMAAAKARGGAGSPESEAYAADLPSAQASEGLLVAQEVDESTVQINKMVEQVAEFVQKDPEVVGHVLERWVESKE